MPAGPDLDHASFDSPAVPLARRETWMSWTVAAIVAVAALGYLIACVDALWHPMNAGDERQWAAVFLGLAAVGALSTLALRTVGARLFVAAPAVAAIALILTSGNGKAALITAWLLVLAAMLGRALSRADHGLDVLPVTMPLGLAALALIALALGLAHLLRPWPIFATLVLLTLPGWRTFVLWAHWLRRHWPHLLAPTHGIALPEANALHLALGVSFLAALTWALVPEIQFDAVNYQLAVPRIYVEHGRTVDLPYFFHSYFAHLVNGLFAIGLALDGQIVAKLLTLATGVVTVAGVYVLGTRALGPRAALWASALFASTPLVVWLGATAYTDLAATMFVLGGFLALLRWRDARSTTSIWTSGALVGAAIGTKLTAVVALPAFVVIIGLTLARRTFPSERWGLTPLSAFACGGLLFGAPWYALIYAFTGNPFFPMLNGIFKSSGWPPENTRLNADMFGIGTSPDDVARLPFALTFDTAKFGETLPAGAVGLAVALLPLGILLVAWRGRHRWCLLGAAALSTLVWSLLFQYARYLVPVLPLIVVVVVVTVLLATPERRGRRVVLGSLALVLVAHFLVTPVLFWNVPERFPLRRALGQETVDAFMTRALPGYAAARYVNRVAAPGEKVIGWHFANVRFYLAPPLVSGETAKMLALAGERPPNETLATLRERGFAYVMVNTRLPIGAHAPIFVRPDVLDCCAVPAFSRQGVVVYRLGGSTAASAGAPNLLRNPGFEARDARGQIDGWGAYGRPQVVVGPAAAHSGQIAVLATPTDGLTQPVKVDAGALYRLSHVSRADRPPQHARLQINWLDRGGQLVDVTIEIVVAEAQWKRHALLITAPDGAVTAIVYASVHSDSRVWLDDFVFARAE